MHISALLILEVMVALLMAAWVYFVGRLFWMMVGGTAGAILNSRRVTARLREEAAALTADQLRTLLLQDDCLTPEVRSYPEIQQFFARLERHDEVALAAEYPRGKISRLIAHAEHELGEHGRSEASPCAYALAIRLQILAAKTGAAPRG